MRSSMVVHYEMDLEALSEEIGLPHCQRTAKALRDILLMEGYRGLPLHRIGEFNRYVSQAKEWTGIVDNHSG